MRLGIMQPYFMPYLGYFSLIEASDRFILFDTPQFIRHGWIERNRILKPNGESLYIKVPLKKHGQRTSINEIEINNSLPWKTKILAQLVQYKKKAKYYREAIDLMQRLFSRDYESIVELNKRSLELTCEYIGINKPIEIFSQLNLDLEPVNSPDEWALNISRSLGGDEYLNLPGGKEFFDKSKYDEGGVELRFIENILSPYGQYGGQFVPGLSIIDIIMFCSPEVIMNKVLEYDVTSLS